MTRQHGIYAVDIKGSAREKLANGFMRVKDSNLTKMQVRQYLGSEVKDSAELGWAPDKSYGVLCPGDELAKAAVRYNNLPFLMGHHDFDPANPPKEFLIGTTGSDASYAEPHLKNTLMLWDKAAIDAIENGDVEELSVGYSYSMDTSEGVFDGTPYHAIMRDIQPEHLALVPKGRAGTDVRVADAGKPGHAYHGNQFSGGQGRSALSGGRPMQQTISLTDKRGRLAKALASKDIKKRKGINPKEGVKNYGSVKFADPKNKRYPINTPAHVRAALSYWGMLKNRSKYSKADQAEIGGRIRAAAKRLGIQTKTGDTAGFNQEIAMAKAKHNPSPLAHRVAGAIEATLRSSKLAKDALPHSSELLTLVNKVSATKFARQIDGIVGTAKDALKLDNETATSLRGVLLDMAAEPEMKDEDGEDEEDEDGEDAAAAPEPDKEAADPDEEAENEAGEDEDGEDAAKDKAKAKKDTMPPALKKALMKKAVGDAVALAVKQVRDEAKALREAERAVEPIVGAVDGFDDAASVYRYALRQRGIDASAVHPSALAAMVQMLTERPSIARAVDAADGGNVSRFDLSSLKRRIG